VDIMKTTSWMTAAAISSLLTLAGCATGPNQQIGIAGGAVGGALLGNAIGGNAASTVGGAAIGGLIGNEVGRNADQRNYNNRGYYPHNGPRY
jgi:osmotically inducible lipoprotein OsmB